MSRIDGGPAFPGKQLAMFAQILGTGKVHHQMPAIAEHNGMSVREYFMANSRLTLHDARDQFYNVNGRYGIKKPDLAELLTLLAQMRGMEADAMLAERAR